VGAVTLEVNAEATGNSLFDEVVLGPASETVPALVERFLNAL
jgi:hypothetical protein